MKIAGMQSSFSCNKPKNLAFGKEYIKRDIKLSKTNFTKSDASFVEYDPLNPNDITEIEDFGRIWKFKAPYIQIIVESFKTLSKPENYNNGIHFYGLEDEYGHPLAIAKVLDIPAEESSKEGAKVYISYIQSDPEQSCTSPMRKYKGVGETLVSEIVQSAKKINANAIELTSTNEFFWESSGFFKNINNKRISEKRLEKANFDKYIDYVESKKRPNEFFACG